MLKVRLNLRNVVAIAICLASFSISDVLAQTSTTDEGVVINNVKWATHNVGAVTPEDYGGYYQWNRGTTDFLQEYDNQGNYIGGYSNSTYGNSSTWLPANDPSPVGYRVPTSAEIQSLTDTTYVKYEWTTQNGVYGGKFTDRENGNSIFLPAAGCRLGNDGTFDYVGSYGEYWSSTQSGIGILSSLAYYLDFSSSRADCNNWGSRLGGLPIRPVANDNTGIDDVLLDTENLTITGYFDILGRKLKDEPTREIYIIQYDNGKTKKIIKR